MVAESTLDMTRGPWRRQYSQGLQHGRRINSDILPNDLGAEAWFWRVNAIADDFGNFPAEPSVCRNSAAPRRRSLRDDQVSEWLRLLEEVGLIGTYESNGDRYGHIVGFVMFQPTNRQGRRVQRYPREPEDLGKSVQLGERKAQAPIRVAVLGGGGGRGIGGEENPPTPQGGTVVLPAALQTEKFRAAWREWLDYRKSIRKRVTRATVERQMALFVKMGHDKAIEAIDRSIAQGWVGLHPSGKPSQSGPAPNSAAEPFWKREGFKSHADYMADLKKRSA